MNPCTYLTYIELALFIWFLVFHFTIESLNDKELTVIRKRITEKIKRGLIKYV